MPAGIPALLVKLGLMALLLFAAVPVEGRADPRSPGFNAYAPGPAGEGGTLWLPVHLIRKLEGCTENCYEIRRRRATERVPLAVRSEVLDRDRTSPLSPGRRALIPGTAEKSWLSGRIVEKVGRCFELQGSPEEGTAYVSARQILESRVLGAPRAVAVGQSAFFLDDGRVRAAVVVKHAPGEGTYTIEHEGTTKAVAEADLRPQPLPRFRGTVEKIKKGETLLLPTASAAGDFSEWTFTGKVREPCYRSRIDGSFEGGRTEVVHPRDELRPYPGDL